MDFLKIRREIIENRYNKIGKKASLSKDKEVQKEAVILSKLKEALEKNNTDKEISVRVRSDLHNIIKTEQSIVSDYQDNKRIDKEENIKKAKEVIENE